MIVRVALELVDRLDREVVERFRSLNARGSEIGGLLLGAVHGDSPFDVSVHDYEPVPCEYSRGPLYQLSPGDFERFERVLQQRACTEGQVVGFFRSHTRKGLSLDAEDVTIFNRFFPNLYQVLLLTKPFATKPTAAGIFIREEGSLKSESSYKEFAFRRSEIERTGASVTNLQGFEKTSPAPARAEQPRDASRAQIVPIASWKEATFPPNQPAAPEPDAEIPAVPAHATGPDHATTAVPSETSPAPAQAAAVRSDPVAEPEHGAEPEWETVLRQAAEDGDWVDSFDFEKLLREDQEERSSTEAFHEVVNDPAAAVAEPAAAAFLAPDVPIAWEPAAWAGPAPSTFAVPEQDGALPGDETPAVTEPVAAAFLAPDVPIAWEPATWAEPAPPTFAVPEQDATLLDDETPAVTEPAAAAFRAPDVPIAWKPAAWAEAAPPTFAAPELDATLLDDETPAVTEPAAAAFLAPDGVVPEPAARAEPAPPTFVAVEQYGALLEKLRSDRRIWIAGGSAAALIVLSGLLVFSGPNRTKRPATTSSPDGSTMSLRVERSAGELLVTWNRDADAIRGATHGVLVIADGERHENVDLDLGLLRNGSIGYSPASSEIVFQLKVTGKNASQTQSESARVFLKWPPPEPDPQPTSPAKGFPRRTTPANAPARVPADASEEAQAPNEVALRPFQADTLSLRLRPTRALDLPDAPGLISGQQPQAVLVPGNVAAPAPPPPVPPAAQVAPPPSPQPRVGGEAREAQLLTQTSPEYPLAARQARVQGSVVISAVVGTDGHIKSAKAVSGPMLLQHPALEALKRWVYRPATLDGIPVESQTRIELNFTLQH